MKKSDDDMAKIQPRTPDVVARQIGPVDAAIPELR